MRFFLEKSELHFLRGMDALYGTDNCWKRIIRRQSLQTWSVAERLSIFNGRCWKVQCSVSVLIRVWKKLENAARMKLRWEMLSREACLEERHAEAGWRRTEAEGASERRHQRTRRLHYLDGRAFREGPFLRLLMLFYGNLLGLLITENRPTFKNKSNVSIGWTQTQWLSKTENQLFA